jgi:hypothetical protein
MSGNREALRQQLLLRALWRRGGAAGALAGWTRGDVAAGLAAYRGNAAALAERALEAAFPTVSLLVGAESFAALARDFWHHHPPERGDLGEWGAELPAFVGASAQLADEPYLADSARLDWRVHQATRAGDAPAAALALERLASVDPSRLRFVLAPGAALVSSAWPIVAIWLAHQASAASDDAFAPVRDAWAAARADTAFVWRDASWRVHVERLDDEPEAAFTGTLLDGGSLATALELSGPRFSFDRWLALALRSQWIAAIDTIELD